MGNLCPNAPETFMIEVSEFQMIIEKVGQKVPQTNAPKEKMPQKKKCPKVFAHNATSALVLNRYIVMRWIHFKYTNNIY